MRKGFIIGVGSLLLSGLLVTQGWAGNFKSDLSCSGPIVGEGKVSIAANGTVKGSIQLDAPLPNPVKFDCEILCGSSVGAGPAPCVDADAGDTTLKIKASGLGKDVSDICWQPAVLVVNACISVYVP